MRTFEALLPLSEIKYLPVDLSFCLSIHVDVMCSWLSLKARSVTRADAMLCAANFFFFFFIFLHKNFSEVLNLTVERHQNTEPNIGESEQSGQYFFYKKIHQAR